MIVKEGMNLHNIVILGTLTTILTSCETDMKRVHQISSKKEAAIETGKDVELIYSMEGKVMYKIEGSRLIRHNTADPFTEFPDNVLIYMYNDSMEIESQLSANYGISYENEDKMIVRDNVILSNSKGETLYTEELIWDEKKALIYSDKFVEITTPREIIYGDGFEASEDFSYYKIKKIRGTIDIDPVEEQAEVE